MSETSNFHFAVPDYGAKPWAHLMQACIQQIDTALASEHYYYGGGATHGNIVCDSIAVRTGGNCTKGTIGSLLWYKRSDRYNNGTYEPYTCATKGFTANQDLDDGSTTINWATDFGVPADAKALVLRVKTQQSDPNVTPDRQGYVRFKLESDTSYNEHYHIHPIDKNVDGQSTGIVAIPNGTSVCEWRSPKAGTKMKIYIWVMGYFV